MVDIQLETVPGVRSLSELTDTQNPRLLTEVEAEVEQGKVLYAPTDNDKDGYVYKIPTGKYLFFIQSGILAKFDTYKNLIEAVEDNPFDVPRTWYVLPDNWLPLRLCADCERPVQDGGMEMGLCFDCYSQMRDELASSQDELSLLPEGSLESMKLTDLYYIRMWIAAHLNTPEEARDLVKVLASTDWKTIFREKKYFEVQHPF